MCHAHRHTHSHPTPALAYVILKYFVLKKLFDARCAAYQNVHKKCSSNFNSLNNGTVGQECLERTMQNTEHVKMKPVEEGYLIWNETKGFRV